MAVLAARIYLAGMDGGERVVPLDVRALGARTNRCCAHLFDASLRAAVALRVAASGRAIAAFASDTTSSSDVWLVALARVA